MSEALTGKTDCVICGLSMDEQAVYIDSNGPMHHGCAPGPGLGTIIESDRMRVALVGIQEIIHNVEARCMAADIVTPTLLEMTEDEMRRIWLHTVEGLK